MSAPASVFSAVRKAIAGSVPVAVVTVVKGEGAGRKLAVMPDGTVGSLGSAALDALAVPEAKRLLEDERSLTQSYPGESGEIELFYEVFPPPPTLLIFGAVHVAQALADVRQAARFPGDRHRCPGKALDSRAVSRR